MPLRRILVAALVGLLPHPADAGEPIRVELKSGRTFTAHVDAKTDNERLWLRFSKGDSHLLRGVNWTEVVRARRQEDELTVDDLRKLVPEIATAAPAREPLHANETLPQREESIRLSSIHFDAHLANWNGDVATDGLIVRLYPLDGEGNIAPVSGTLEVTLAAARRRDFNEWPQARGQSVETIARWTVPVSAADLRSSGAVLRLPFQAIHPELDTAVSASGLVHLRYAAPGHGVFEASQDVVRIRPYAPLRDLRERSGLDRRLSVERSGR